MVAETISQSGDEVVAPLLRPRESAAVPPGTFSADRQPLEAASIEAVMDVDAEFLLRWYPLFMAGLILGMVALGGFWISRFAM